MVFRPFASVVTILNILLGVIPGTPGICHENSLELSGDDDACQEATQSLLFEQQANGNGGKDSDETQGDQLTLGSPGRDGDDLGVIGGLFATHDGRDAQLAADFSHDITGSPVDSFDQKTTEQQRQGPTEQQADEYYRISKIDHPLEGVYSFNRDDPLDIDEEGTKQGDCGNNRRTDGYTFGDRLGGVTGSIQVCQDLAGFIREFFGTGQLGNPIGIVCNRAECIHADVVPGVREHTDTNQGDPKEDIGKGIAGFDTLALHTDQEKGKDHGPHGEEETRDNLFLLETAKDKGDGQDRSDDDGRQVEAGWEGDGVHQD